MALSRGGVVSASGRNAWDEKPINTRVAGVDGTKGGWVAVELLHGRFAGACVLPFDSRLEELRSAEVIAIDVPIGFGPRAADAEARRYLRGAASTVFTTPTREQLEVPFGPGRGLSSQAHALGTRILHMTALAAADARLREVHPEVSFRAMNGGAPLRYRKKSFGGVFERLRLLGRHGIELGDLGASASAPIDDVLDAGAAAWSAHRIAEGTSQSLPDPAARGHRGATGRYLVLTWVANRQRGFGKRRTSPRTLRGRRSAARVPRRAPRCAPSSSHSRTTSRSSRLKRIEQRRIRFRSHGSSSRGMPPSVSTFQSAPRSGGSGAGAISLRKTA